MGVTTNKCPKCGSGEITDGMINTGHYISTCVKCGNRWIRDRDIPLSAAELTELARTGGKLWKPAPLQNSADTEPMMPRQFYTGRLAYAFCLTLAFICLMTSINAGPPFFCAGLGFILGACFSDVWPVKYRRIISASLT